MRCVVAEDETAEDGTEYNDSESVPTERTSLTHGDPEKFTLCQLLCYYIGRIVCSPFALCYIVFHRSPWFSFLCCIVFTFSAILFMRATNSLPGDLESCIAHYPLLPHQLLPLGILGTLSVQLILLKGCLESTIQVTLSCFPCKCCTYRGSKTLQFLVFCLITSLFIFEVFLFTNRFFLDIIFVMQHQNSIWSMYQCCGHVFWNSTNLRGLCCTTLFHLMQNTPAVEDVFEQSGAKMWKITETVRTFCAQWFDFCLMLYLPVIIPTMISHIASASVIYVWVLLAMFCLCAFSICLAMVHDRELRSGNSAGARKTVLLMLFIFAFLCVEYTRLCYDVMMHLYQQRHYIGAIEETFSPRDAGDYYHHLASETKDYDWLSYIRTFV